MVQRRTNATPYVDPNTPKKDRVYIGEGHRLIDSPSRKQLHYRRKDGIRIWSTGGRLKMKFRRDNDGFWTTVEHDRWWNDELDRLECAD